MKKIQGKDKALVVPNAIKPKATGQLLSDIHLMIEQSHHRFSQAINAEMVFLYWNIGTRIRRDILKEKRATYGEEIIPVLAVQLNTEYGRGFTRSNLFNMIRFAEVYPDREIVHALSGQLSWTHIREILYLEGQLKRDFYAEMCRIERWSTRTLKGKIDSMLYERTAISKKPTELAMQELRALREEDKMTPDLVFRDPYVLDFLGLSDAYSERDLESAILRELEKFLLELGTSFTFVAPAEKDNYRQRRLLS
jgi:predicted nuclease of restriction endonuclease-like (RecB) superfamily